MTELYIRTPDIKDFLDIRTGPISTIQTHWEGAELDILVQFEVVRILDQE